MASEDHPTATNKSSGRRGDRSPSLFDNRFTPGDLVISRTLTSITGQDVRLPDPDQLIHLQFRRFAGCPICNLHLRSFIQRDDEITDAGVREVIVFHSTTEELLRNEPDVPLAIIADPDKNLYTEFRVGTSWRSVMDPGAMSSVPRAAWLATKRRFTVKAPLPLRPATNGRIGLVADFLITPDRRIADAKYGRHSGDAWSVDEVLALAADTR
jgi:peroxiredoxin